MDLDELDHLKTIIRALPSGQQDNLAAMLLMERLKRNQLIMPDIHSRVEDSDPKNWQEWQDTKNKLGQ